MTHDRWCEARTQGAPICRHIGATEDAASRRLAPVRRPGLLSEQALDACRLDHRDEKPTQRADRLRQARRERAHHRPWGSGRATRVGGLERSRRARRPDGEARSRRDLAAAEKEAFVRSPSYSSAQASAGRQRPRVALGGAPRRPVRFWDASALIPLVVEERQSEPTRELHREDAAMIVWWATEVECASALARLQRSGSLPRETANRALDVVATLAETWQEVAPLGEVRRSAMRLLARHPLRAADALQLAAAIEASEADPGSLPFVTLDDRLREATELEGFRALPAPA